MPNFKVGDKVIILPSFFTKLFDIAGKKATVVWVSNGNSEQLEQVRVEVPDKGRFYLLLSEVKKYEYSNIPFSMVERN